MNEVYMKFEELVSDIERDFISKSRFTKVDKWQSLDVKDQAFGNTYELLNYSFLYNIPTIYVHKLEDQIKPNLPWASNHFLERVCGLPLNPGKEFANWPFYRSPERDKKFRVKEEKFSHTYMSRLWCPKMQGMNGKWGNLGDIVELLNREPSTRQAYVSLWHPEDNGALNGRVPCTLGYNFLLRDNNLHISYYIRSCDYIRHFRDDVYMAIRLCIWIIEELRKKNPSFWNNVTPGSLFMTAASFHMFENDYKMMFKKY